MRGCNQFCHPELDWCLSPSDRDSIISRVFVIARNEVAGQSSPADAKLDCFATLVMTLTYPKGTITDLSQSIYPTRSLVEVAEWMLSR